MSTQQRTGTVGHHIPCVVGTATATKSIKSGDRVRVDGRQGIVQVFASQP